MTVTKRDFIVFLEFLLLLVIGFSVDSVQAKLTIAKECGELVCKPHNYCSQVDHSCRPCQVACDPALGNYDKDVCEKFCQDYLHDLWYMRKPENESDFREEFYIELYYKVQQDLRLLKILIGIVIILSTIVTLALLFIMIYFKRLRNKFQVQQFSGKKKMGDLPVIYSNSKVLSLPFPDVQRGPPSHISSGSINNNLSPGSSPDLVSRTNTTLTNYNNSFFPSANQSNSSKKKKKEKDMSFVMENPRTKTIVTQTSENSDKQNRLRKEPSESTLPDFHAYDNPALVPSPVNVHM